MENLNKKELVKLISENPELPIMCMVDSECVQDDGYGWWTAKIGKPVIDEYYRDDERVCLKSDDFDELVEEFFNDNYGYDQYGEMTDEQLEEIAEEVVADYEWTKAITLPIRPL